MPTETGPWNKLRLVLLKRRFWIVIIAFILGLTFGIASWYFFIPYLQDNNRSLHEEQMHQLRDSLKNCFNNPIYLVKGAKRNHSLPIKIGIFGPITGELKEFGLSHLRGIKGALLNFTFNELGLPEEQCSNYFDIKIYNTGASGSSFSKDTEKLIRDFKEAQNECDVVFGPLFSETTKRIILGPNLELRVPTIITNASTPKIKEHYQYGQFLFQISNDINSYASQFVRYFAEFNRIKPEVIYCLYRKDEYGESSNQALGKYAAHYNIRDYQFLEIPPLTPGQDRSNMLSSPEIQGFIKQIQLRNGKHDVLFIIDFSDNLQFLVNYFNSLDSTLQIATLTSIHPSQIEKGLFDDTFLIYSYIPKIVTVQTLEFYKYCRIGQIQLNDLLQRNNLQIGGPWHPIGTVEAEVHDATIFWLFNFTSLNFKNSSYSGERKYYITDFIIEGQGKKLGNNGSLPIFNVQNGVMTPVEIYQ